MRRTEKSIQDQIELINIIRSAKYMTLALCRNQQPYLVTLNYGYDEEINCFYFHAAQEGKKIDYLRDNPQIWGQIIEDLGYQMGHCDHAFRTIHFKGKVEFLEDIHEIRDALFLMIDQLEDEADSLKGKFSNPNAFKKTAVARVQVLEMWGKQSLPK